MSINQLSKTRQPKGNSNYPEKQREIQSSQDTVTNHKQRSYGAIALGKGREAGSVSQQLGRGPEPEI